MMQRIVPVFKQIAKEHLGENIAVVTHGGVFKVLNYYLGKFNDGEGTISIPNGEVMLVNADKDKLYLKS